MLPARLGLQPALHDLGSGEAQHEIQLPRQANTLSEGDQTAWGRGDGSEKVWL